MSNLCYYCDGYGTDPWNDHILPCPVCDGKELADALLKEGDLPCPVCDGKEGDLLGFDDEWMDDNGEGE